MKCPCTKDCKQRSATCRLSCKAWQAYEKARNEGYAEKKQERDFWEHVYLNIQRKCRRR